MFEGLAGSRLIWRIGTSAVARLASALMVLIVLGFSFLPERAEAQNYRFNSVVVEGNQRVEPAAIMSYAGIARGQVVTAAELNDAYQRIVASGLFETVDLAPRGNTLSIRVSEYPTINVVSIEGNKRMKNKVLLPAIESQSRRVFNPNIAEQDAARITNIYSEAGRLAARVTPRIIKRSDNRVDLVFEIFEGGLVEIERIGFVGNDIYSDRRLRRVLQTKQATLFRFMIQRDTLVEDRIQFDKQVLQDFYMSRGYVDFRISSVNAELARARDGYFVTFNVQEGDQFRFGEITTVSEMSAADAEDFQDALKIKPGVVYSPSLVESSIARMERLALIKGIDFLRVEPRISRNDRDLALNVEFVLTKGKRIFVERIDVEGNATTLDRVIRQQFTTVEGDPFNPRDIRQSAERIRALGFFADAQVDARQGSSEDLVVVDVDVEEQPTGSLSFGGSYSSASGLGIVLEFKETNFLGRGQQLSFNLSGSTETNDYSIGFVEPHFLGRDLAFALSLSYIDSSYSDARWESTVGRFQPSFKFPIGEFSRLAVRYTLSHAEMSVDSVIAGSYLDNEASLGGLMSSGVGYTYSFDTRDSGLNPTSGTLLQLEQDFSGLGGDVESIKTKVLASAETKILHEEVTLRATFQGGALYTPNADSRVTDRFLLGDEMRGFTQLGFGPREYDSGTSDNDALGGKYFAVASLEAEFPLGLPDEYGISGGLFYNAGSLWGLDGTSTGPGVTLYEKASIRHVIGASLFWDTPIGPLRFDFSHTLKKQSFDEAEGFSFSIKTKF